MQLTDSTDRDAIDYILFGMGFVGFVFAASGVVLNCIALAVFGLLGLLFVFGIFSAR